MTINLNLYEYLALRNELTGRVYVLEQLNRRDERVQNLKRILAKLETAKLEEARNILEACYE